MKYFTVLFTIIALTNFSSTSFAQSDEFSAKMTDPDVTIVEVEEADDEYAAGTVQNFSKLYWKLGALDISNKTAIDNFLRINECDIYTSFFNDDFQWSSVRDAAKNMIQEEIGNFPDKFRFTFPIDLGRYDMKKGGFPIISRTGIKDLRRVQISGNSINSKVCKEAGVIPFYPKNIVVILNRPLTFDFLSLDEHVAQAFIVRRKYGDLVLSQNDRGLGYQRIAFMQLRVSMSHFQGLQKANGASDEQLAVVYGKIDAIDVYEDRARTRLLKSIPLIKKKKTVRPTVTTEPTPTEKEVSSTEGTTE